MALSTISGTTGITDATITSAKLADFAAAVDLNGVELILDADQDTSITADTDDRIDFKIAGVEHISISNSSGDTVIKPMVDAKDIVFQQYDGNKIFEINDGNFVAVSGAAAGPGEIRIYEDTDNGSHYTGFKAGNNTASVAYVLPTADGTDGFQLTTDGSGTLSWSSAGTTLANDGNNRVVTGTGSGLNGEANLTFDGSTLAVTGAATVSGNLTGSGTVQGTTITATTAFVPDASDGAALGTSSLEFSDLFLADAAVISLGDDDDVTITHVADTGILINSTNVIQFNDASQNIGAPSNAILDINATDEIELNATLVDVNANLDVSGTITSGGVITGTAFTAGSAVLAEAELELLDGLTAGTAIASKVVTTDASIDTSGQRNLTISGELDAATGDFSGVVDIAGATTTAAITASGIIKTDDTTAATSTTDGSLQTDGGLSVAGDAIIGDDVTLISDAAVLSFGANAEVTLTHVHDTGILLNSTNVIQFNDASQNIGAPSNAILDINATDEIELNATLVDINANVEISGTAVTTGVHTFTAVPVFPNNTIETADIQADAITAAKIADNAVVTAGINADAVTGAKIADDAINSEHYTDGSIDTAHIADGQVTVGKLATAVLTGATDIGADIADADLFLVDDGAGGTLRKTAASRLKTYVGTAGRATLIDTITLSNSNTAVFDSSDITNAFDNYMITVENLITGSGNVFLKMRLSNNNGSSYEGDSANDYHRISFNGIENESNNGFTSRYSTGTAHIALTGNYANNGNDAALKIDGYVQIFTVNSSSYKKTLGFFMFGQTDDPPKLVYEQAVHVCDGTQSVINNIKIFPSSGNMASGKIKLFGLA